MHEAYEALGRGAANHVALSPLSFLRRAEVVYGPRPAVSYGRVRHSWAEVADRVRRVAGGLRARGVGLGDTVSVLCPNIPELFELHYAVPLAGAVLNTLNFRLEAETIAYILDHSDCRLVICDSGFSGLLGQAFALMGRALPVVDIVDAQAGGAAGFGQSSYDDLLAADPADWAGPADEWQALALNYTSGTSGRPKGVVYHHRGAYLMAMGTVAGWALPPHPVYLSVVPMFNCNGWNHPWAMAIVGAHLVFTRDAVPARLFAAIAAHGVTHLGAAPVILQMLCESADAPAQPYEPKVRVMTAGAPPPPAVLEKAARLGLAAKQAMQGVAFPMVEGIRVVDLETGVDVPMDGTAQGEIAIRGNTVMKGYYKDPAATAAAFRDGWFWSGDAAVLQPGGYVQIRDRLKDVIISGGENISSVEVEAVLYRHPAVLAAAVVARPSEKWGESPCVFVELREGHQADEAVIIGFCRAHLAGIKLPKSVVFQVLPKTATGKIQKFILREAARAMGPLG